MQIKLIPPPPHPSILFTLSFPNPSQTLPLPLAYSSLLHTLSISSPPLDLPNSLLALDKATYLVEVLQEVAFDMGRERVRCVWVDGGIEEWALVDGMTGGGEGGKEKEKEECARMLGSVLRDVDLSAEVGERERLWDEWERFGYAQSQAQAQAAAVSTPQKAIKHKKQRSLLMSLVASLVPTSLPLPSSSSPPPTPAPTPAPTLPRTPPPPAPAPPQHPNTPDQPLTSRQLRHRARSTLVDAWRRYVLPALNARVSRPAEGGKTGMEMGIGTGTRPGGYHLWIIHSMIRKAESHMACLVSQNGGVVPSLEGFGGLRGGHARSVLSSPFYEDDDEGGDQGEGDGGSESTDTDGSSVHTPSESCVPFPAAPADTKPQPPPLTPLTPSPLSLQLPRSPSPPSPPSLSPTPTPNFPQPNRYLQTYKSLSTHTHRLHHLLKRLDLLSLRARAEERVGMDMLEVKSRRRAWGNGVYLAGVSGGGRGGKGELGLGMPFRSSPLRRGWVVGEEGGEGEGEGEGVEVQMRVVEADLMNRMRIDAVPSLSPSQSQSRLRLFPVSQDEEAYERDLESGLFALGAGPAGPGASVSFVPDFEERPLAPAHIHPLRARMRTQSMHRLQTFEEGEVAEEEDITTAAVGGGGEEHGSGLVPTILIPQPLLLPLPLQPIPHSPPPPPPPPPSHQRPALTRAAPFCSPESHFSPSSPSECSPPPYTNADEERRMVRLQQCNLFEYDNLLPPTDDESLSDESTLVSSSSSESESGLGEFTLALDSPGLFGDMKVYGSDEWLSRDVVDCR